MSGQPTYSVLEPPTGFVFKVTMHFHGGQTMVFYVDSMTEDFGDYNIPPNIQNIYPDAPVIIGVNPNDISGYHVQSVIAVGAPMGSEGEIPSHNIDGEEAM